MTPIEEFIPIVDQQREFSRHDLIHFCLRDCWGEIEIVVFFFINFAFDLILIIVSFILAFFVYDTWKAPSGP